jgi:hypothetical protein
MCVCFILLDDGFLQNLKHEKYHINTAVIDAFYFLTDSDISQQDVTQKEHCTDNGVVSHFTIASIPSTPKILESHFVPFHIFHLQAEQNHQSFNENEAKIDPIMYSIWWVYLVARLY